MSFLKINSTNIYYEVHENILAEDTLFIHGNLASHQWWHPCLTILENQNQNKQHKGKMILVDWRGCGESSAPCDFSEMKMGNLANDLNLIIDHLKLQKVHLVGHSTGGFIALNMVIQRPELFSKILLLDSVGAKGVQLNPEIEAAFDQMQKDKELTAAVIGSTIYNLNSEDTFFKEVIVEDAFNAVKNLGKSILYALKDVDVKKKKKKINNPTLVLHGEHDDLLPKEDSQKLASLLSNARYMEIPGQGHCCNYENPKLFVKYLNEFL